MEDTDLELKSDVNYLYVAAKREFSKCNYKNSILILEQIISLLTSEDKITQMLIKAYELKYKSLLQMRESDITEELKSQIVDISSFLQSNYRKTALEFYNICDYQNALVFFEKELKISPTHKSYYLVGNCYFSMNDNINALRNFQFAIISLEVEKMELGYFLPSIQKIHLKYIASKSLVLTKINRFIEAEKNILQLLINDPLHMDLNYALGYLYYKTEKFDEALEKFKIVLNFNNCSDSAKYIGKIYFFRNKFKHALNYFLKSCNFAKKITINFSDIIFSIDNLRDKKLALEYCEKFYEKFKKFEFFEKKCEILISLGLSDEAFLCYNNFKTSNSSENSRIKYHISKIFFSQKNYPQAIELAKESILLDPKNPNPKFLLAEIYLKNNEIDLSLIISEGLIQEFPKYFGGYFIKAEIYFQRNLLDKSLFYADQALDRDSSNQILQNFKLKIISMIVGCENQIEDFSEECDIFEDNSSEILSPSSACRKASISSDIEDFSLPNQTFEDRYLVKISLSDNIFDENFFYNT